MKKYTYDSFLHLEHAVDTAVDEAWGLYRSKRSSNPFVSDQARNMASELEQILKKIRNLRQFTLNNVSDMTYEEMLEDNSRYLED